MPTKPDCLTDWGWMCSAAGHFRSLQAPSIQGIPHDPVAWEAIRKWNAQLYQLYLEERDG